MTVEHQENNGCVAREISCLADLPHGHCIRFFIDSLDFSYTANKVERFPGQSDGDYESACELQCLLPDRIIRFLQTHLNSTDHATTANEMSIVLQFLSELVRTNADDVEALLGDAYTAIEAVRAAANDS